jgi:hypothetical protein
MADHKNDTERASIAEEILDLVMADMLARLKHPGPCAECSMRGLTATDHANFLKFLKDNGFDVSRKATQDALDKLIQDRKGEPRLPQDPNPIN